MSCHIRYIYSSLCLFCVVSVAYLTGVTERRCFSTVLQECWVGETCLIQKLDHVPQGGEKDGICSCLRDHVRDSEGYCVPLHPTLPSPSRINADAKSSSGSIAAGILVPLFFIGAAVIVVMARRYGWWERLRQPRILHYDTALVGGDLDDDPPIA